MGLSDLVYVDDSWPDVGLGLEMFKFVLMQVQQMNGKWVEIGDLDIPGEKWFLKQKLFADFSEVLVYDVGKTHH